MQISNLKTLATPNLNDVLPILDINGGVSGKAILRKATLGSLLALVEQSNNDDIVAINNLISEISNKVLELEQTTYFTIPTLIKYSNNDDYLLLVDANGTIFKTTKSDLLSGLNSGESGGNTATATGWINVTNDYSPSINSKIVLSGSTNINLNLPSTLGEIEIYNNSSGTATIAPTNYNNFQYNAALGIKSGYTRLLRISNTIGWYPLVNTLNLPVDYPTSDLALLLSDGSLLDKSVNGRNATPIGGNSPLVTTGLDGKKVLRWSGAGNQELQVSPFLASATGATIYIVFTVSANTHYNLIRTANLDDYWRFATDGNGYFGTLLSARRNGYPTTMPSSGSHLVSIHSSSTSYEVILDKVSKGNISNLGFSPGDRFRIGTNDKPFSGDIALLLVYNAYILPGSSKDISLISNIKNAYPSLPF